MLRFLLLCCRLFWSCFLTFCSSTLNKNNGRFTLNNMGQRSSNDSLPLLLEMIGVKGSQWAFKCKWVKANLLLHWCLDIFSTQNIRLIQRAEWQPSVFLFAGKESGQSGFGAFLSGYFFANQHWYNQRKCVMCVIITSEIVLSCFLHHREKINS